MAEAPKAPINVERGELLGAGGFGKVYKCRDTDTNQIYAVKIVEFGNKNKESCEEAQNLETEIKAYSMFQHERIVQYFGCKNDSEEFSIFIEYMPGGSVRDLIKKQGKLDESIVRKYSQQILSGLAYLHSKSVIHRDIKAANVLRDASDNIKLADFGLCKRLTTICSGTKTTVGTANWMAPEVVTEEKYNYKADIWSLGCTVVEMLSSHPPFHKYKTVFAIITKIGQCEKPEYELPPSVSDSAKEFLLQTFKRTQDDRSSAEELLKHRFVANSLY